MTGLIESDITVTGGTIVAGSLATTNNRTWTVSVTPAPNSTSPLAVSVASGVASDAAGNGNIAGSAGSQAVDTVAPTVTITDDEIGTAKIAGGNVVYTLVFSEAVTGLIESEITVTGGTILANSLTSADSGLTWTVSVTPAPNSTTPLAVSVASGVASDAAGNGNIAGSAGSQAVDTVAPTVTITDDETGTANIAGGDVVYTLVFSEAVTGLIESDITVTGGTVVAGSLATTDNLTWTVSVTPAPNSTTPLAVSVASGVASNAAGNGNIAGSAEPQAVDTVVPVATDATATTNEDTAITVDVAGNVTDADNNTLSIISAVIVGNASVGSVSFAGTVITYDPAGLLDDLATGESVTVTVEYVISDGTSVLTATLTIMVDGVNEPIIGVVGGGTISGTPFEDDITGTDADDVINAEGQDDNVFGNGGNDRLIGGAGADMLDGGSGTDVADYSASPIGLRIDMLLSTFGTGDAAGDTFVSVENIIATSFNDEIRGDANNNTVWTGNGNDVIFGRGGADSLNGGNGNDNLFGGDGADFLNGGSGVDTVSYGDAAIGVAVDLLSVAANTGFAAGDTFVSIENLAGSSFNDILRGDNGANSLWGGKGNDQLFGRSGDDFLSGGNGNDLLGGGGGTDILFGGAGADSFQFHAGSGSDSVTDFNRVQGDRIDLSIYTGINDFAALSGRIAQVGTGTVITLLGGDRIVLQNTTAADLVASDFIF